MRNFKSFLFGYSCYLATVVALIGMVGCQSMKDNEAATKLVVQYAVAKYAEQIPDAVRNERVGRIKSIAEDVKTVVSTNDTVSLSFLSSLVMERLDKTGLSPADRVLANGLVSMIADELSKKVQTGVLSADERVQVEAVMDWVIQAATLIAPVQSEAVEK